MMVQSRGASSRHIMLEVHIINDDNMMNRPRLRRRSPASDSAPCQDISSGLLLKCSVFAVAFWIGSQTGGDGAPRAPSTDSTLHSNSNGWNTIQVFYGNTPKLDSNITWHSQQGQDELVATLLNLKRNGYFIDLAANDALHWSNTAALESQYSWTGLCIEPTPRYWYNLTTIRSCQAVAAVVGNATPSQIRWKRRKEYSGIVGDEFDNHVRKNKTYPTKYTVPLSTVFQRFHVPRIVDYLSFDVEGAEEYILQDFLPTTNYRFHIMTIERPSKTLWALLEQHGYVYRATLSDWGETIWSHSSISFSKNQMALLESFKEKYPTWEPRDS